VNGARAITVPDPGPKIVRNSAGSFCIATNEERAVRSWKPEGARLVPARWALTFCKEEPRPPILIVFAKRFCVRFRTRHLGPIVRYRAFFSPALARSSGGWGVGKPTIIIGRNLPQQSCCAQLIKS
jgi:hypothetical protein